MKPTTNRKPLDSIKPGDGGRRRPNDERRLYADLAWIFPLFTPIEDYRAETEAFCRLIRRAARIPVRSLLHLGCGAGHNDSIFKKHFQVAGIDLSPRMLALARKRNPEVDYRRGDMRTVRLGRLFDAVVCIDSLDYMAKENDLAAAFAAAFAHLRPGGVFFFMLEHLPSTFRQNRTTVSRGAPGPVEIVSIQNDYDPDPSDTSYESTFVHLIRRNGRLSIQTDRHVCGLYSAPRVLRLLRRTGFRASVKRYHPAPEALGRPVTAGLDVFPMFFGIKP